MSDIKEVFFDKFNKLNTSKKILYVVLVTGAIFLGLKDAWFSNIWIPANTELEFMLTTPYEGRVSKLINIKGHKVIDEGNFAILIPPDLDDKTQVNKPFKEVTIISNFFDQLTFTLDKPLELETAKEIIGAHGIIKAHSKYNLKLEKAHKKFIKAVDKDSFDVVHGNPKIALLKIESRVMYNFFKFQGSKQYDIGETIVKFVVTDKRGIEDLSIENPEGTQNDEFNDLIKQAVLNTKMPKLNKSLPVTMQFGLVEV